MSSYNLNLQQEIKEYDHNLNFIKVLQVNLFISTTYLVNDENGTLMVFKQTNSFFDHQREVRALDKLVGSPYTPDLIYSYEYPRNALLRSYFPEVNFGKLKSLESIDKKEELFDIVNYLHKSGVANLDLQNKNVILTEKGIKLVDFDTAVIKEDVLPSQFSRAVFRDHADLRKLFSK